MPSLGLFCSSSDPSLCLLCRYADFRQLSRPLKFSLIKHFRYLSTKGGQMDETQLLGQCPPALRSEVTRFVLADTIGRVPIFSRNCDPEFQVGLSPCLLGSPSVRPTCC